MYENTAISKPERFFIILTTVFIASLVLTNLIAGKYFVCFGLPLSCSALVYPFTFLVTDIISEIYGSKQARLLVWGGLLVSITNTTLIWITTKLPIDIHSPIKEHAFNQTLGLVPGIVIGSMIAYIIAQFVDVQVFAYVRKYTGQKHLWLRNNASTLASQLLDTVIVVTFSLVIWPMFNKDQHIEPVGWELWKQIVLGQYLLKGILTLLETPLVYISIYWIKRWITI
jgi:uncharacterized integral membrane protein (TIGR00697 family)